MPPRRVVCMAVAVDQMDDRLFEAAVDLGLQPLGGSGVDGISDYNALLCDHDRSRVKVVVEAPDIASDILEVAHCVLRDGGKCKCEGQGG